MIYIHKAHPTKYRSTIFRSRLEARYAAYFDLCEFKWEYEPVDLDGWTPDFKVTVPCSHSECAAWEFAEGEPPQGDGWRETWQRNQYDPPRWYRVTRYPGHEFWVEIKPYGDKSQFDDHACQRFNDPYSFPAIGLGQNPLIETRTEFAHGAGGGEEYLSNWVRDQRGSRPADKAYLDALWAEAGNRTRYQPRP